MSLKKETRKQQVKYLKLLIINSYNIEKIGSLKNYIKLVSKTVRRTVGKENKKIRNKIWSQWQFEANKPNK